MLSDDDYFPFAVPAGGVGGRLPGGYSRSGWPPPPPSPSLSHAWEEPDIEVDSVWSAEWGVLEGEENDLLGVGDLEGGENNLLGVGDLGGVGKRPAVVRRKEKEKAEVEEVARKRAMMGGRLRVWEEGVKVKAGVETAADGVEVFQKEYKAGGYKGSHYKRDYRKGDYHKEGHYKGGYKGKNFKEEYHKGKHYKEYKAGEYKPKEYKKKPYSAKEYIKAPHTPRTFTAPQGAPQIHSASTTNPDASTANLTLEQNSPTTPSPTSKPYKKTRRGIRSTHASRIANSSTTRFRTPGLRTSRNRLSPRTLTPKDPQRKPDHWILPEIPTGPEPTRLQRYIASQPRTNLERWKVEKANLQAKFQGAHWEPKKKLSPEALDGIRLLNKDHPEYTTEKLSHLFEVSPDAIRRVLKSKWRPDEATREERMERWERRGASVWARWVDMGVVSTKKIAKEKKTRKRIREERWGKLQAVEEEEGVARVKMNIVGLGKRIM